jgi:hypothetical protein
VNLPPSSCLLLYNEFMEEHLSSFGGPEFSSRMKILEGNEFFRKAHRCWTAVTFPFLCSCLLPMSLRHLLDETLSFVQNPA